MIISASYKTDIAAFYGEWFMNRLRAGYCQMTNTYNHRAVRVPLNRDAVDGIVFWTKNIGPFIPHLAEVKQRGYPFMVQHTITGYPHELEQSVISAGYAVENFRRVADQFGPQVCVWRYDTIINSSLTPRAFHVETFSRLARRLAGATDQVVISFIHIYDHTRRNLDQAAAVGGFTWSDPSDDWKRALTVELTAIAAAHSIRLTICSQPQFVVPGSADARCVDATRLNAISGRAIQARLRGNRPGCSCYQSRDIGAYDTCPHDCLYCYAVQNRDLAKLRHQKHDPHGEALIPLAPDAVPVPQPFQQLDLFP